MSEYRELILDIRSDKIAYILPSLSVENYGSVEIVEVIEKQAFDSMSDALVNLNNELEELDEQHKALKKMLSEANNKNDELLKKSLKSSPFYYDQWKDLEAKYSQMQQQYLDEMNDNDRLKDELDLTCGAAEKNKDLEAKLAVAVEALENQQCDNHPSTLHRCTIESCERCQALAKIKTEPPKENI